MAFAKLGIDWKQVKKFWTSKSVKISVAIFLGIAALMGVIVLVSMLVGCAPSNHYTKVKSPTLILENVGNHGNFSRAFMVVANPTSETLKYKVNCCVPYDPTQCMSQDVTVETRSDERVSFNTLAPLSCSLD